MWVIGGKREEEEGMGEGGEDEDREENSGEIIALGAPQFSQNPVFALTKQFAPTCEEPGARWVTANHNTGNVGEPVRTSPGQLY